MYPNVPRCQHIKINGTRCGSPALRSHNLCFFHQRWHQQRIVMPFNYPDLETSIELPVLEDANSVQMAITQVMRLILMAKISDKQAGKLLYALQIASNNLQHTRFEDTECHVVIDPATLARAGVGIDSWKPADFPTPLPAQPKNDATFTPDPSEPVFYDGVKRRPAPPATSKAAPATAAKQPAATQPAATQPADEKKPAQSQPAASQDAASPASSVLPEIKAHAEDYLPARRTLRRVVRPTWTLRSNSTVV